MSYRIEPTALYDAAAVAVYLGVSKRTAQKFFREGVIVGAFRLGRGRGIWRVRGADLLRLGEVKREFDKA